MGNCARKPDWTCVRSSPNFGCARWLFSQNPSIDFRPTLFVSIGWWVDQVCVTVDCAIQQKDLDGRYPPLFSHCVDYIVHNGQELGPGWVVALSIRRARVNRSNTDVEMLTHVLGMGGFMAIALCSFFIVFRYASSRLPIGIRNLNWRPLTHSFSTRSPATVTRCLQPSFSGNHLRWSPDRTIERWRSGTCAAGAVSRPSSPGRVATIWWRQTALDRPSSAATTTRKSGSGTHGPAFRPTTLSCRARSPRSTCLKTAISWSAVYATTR